jgi:hypothetical protein
MSSSSSSSSSSPFPFPLQKKITKNSLAIKDRFIWKISKAKITDPVFKSSTEAGFAKKHNRFQPHPLLPTPKFVMPQNPAVVLLV